jgi:hypothetical protein
MKERNTGTRAMSGSRGRLKEAVDDFYPTPPTMTEQLLRYERTFFGTVWEPAAGQGHMVNVLRQHGCNVYASDFKDYGFALDGVKDFRLCELPEGVNHIVTNPPYSISDEFVSHALDIVPNGGRVAMLVRLQFLESVGRYERFFGPRPPARVHVFVKRESIYKDGIKQENSGAICYAWIVWEKNDDGSFVTPCVLNWIDNRTKENEGGLL